MDPQTSSADIRIITEPKIHTTVTNIQLGVHSFARSIGLTLRKGKTGPARAAIS